MKKILLATTLLAAGTTASFADVTLSGDGRLGIKDAGAGAVFSSRARVSFTLAATSDTGLTIGGSFGVHDAVNAAAGKAGSVFVSGAFGKLSMGSVVGAAEAAVGDVGTADVGYTGLIAGNDGAFITGDASYTTALYEYALGDATLYIGGGDTANAEDSIGLAYKIAGYTLGLGYENNFTGAGVNVATSVSVAGNVGPIAAKALYLTRDAGKQLGLSGTYTADALAVTATWVNIVGTGETDYGVGAAYALGGGLTLAGGYASNDGDSVYDLGLKFKF
ncbi:MAG: porin [Rhodobacteraceae bacterium]|nr:porin [Paracoccaceae bacterium]